MSMQTRVDLAAALRAAAMYGLNEGIDNHFSALVPGRSDRFLLSPFGLHWSEMRARDLLELDLDGTLIEGEESALEATAVEIHRAVHAAHPEANCVLHTHMVHATAVASTVEGFDTRLTQNSLRFHGRVATVDYAGLADHADEAERLAAAAVPGIRVVLLANHGAMVIGESIPHAWKDLYFFERACQVQLLATAATPRRVPDDVVDASVADLERERVGTPQLLFEAVKRQLDAQSPGFRH